MKKLYLTVLATALVMAMIVPTGVANAAPPPLKNHEPTHVEGTLEIVNWEFDMTKYVVDPITFDYTWSDNIFTMEMYGDLEGTYIINLTYTGNIFDPNNYGMTGIETFQGTLMGQRVSYRAEMVGSGIFSIPPPTGFAGSESWISTIVSADSPLSHLRGVINFSGTFDEFADPPIQDYTYSGELVWQTGKKH